MGNIFKFEMKALIKPTLFWLLAMAGIQTMMMAIFPTFEKDLDLVEKLLASYPEEMLKAFGMSSAMSLSTVTGYMVFAFAFVQLCLAIQSSYLGFSIVSKEEREWTADFLLSKPVQRKTILTAKLMAALLSLVVTLVSVALVTYLSIEAFKGQGYYQMKSFVALFIGMAFFQVFFLSLGLVISVVRKKIKNVLSFALALSLGTYVLNAIRAIVGGDLLGWLTPFYYYDLSYILEHGSLNTGPLVVSSLLIVISIATTYYAYTRKNIGSL